MPHSLVTILTTAFTALTALALPNPTDSPLPTLPNDFPPGLGPPGLLGSLEADQGTQFGVAHGSPFDKLEFTVYAEPDCKGTPAGIYDGSYGFYSARQMQSYHLNRTLLHGAEQLDFYAGLLPGLLELNHTVDHDLDGHMSTSCLEHDFTMGLQDERVGCHTLEFNEWCAVISKTGNPESSN